MDQELPEHICKSCGNKFSGFFCNVCGEKVLVAKDRSFKSFLNSLLQSFTLADGTIVKTLWLVVTKPGFLSKEYSAGRRVRYLKPLSLFFALNLVYFLFPVIQLFNASLITQLHSWASGFIQQMVAHKMNIDDFHNTEAFMIIYNQKTTNLAKLIVMVFVVIATVPLAILYRKKGYYFIDHMGFMVELVCFNLFLNAIVLTLILRFIGVGHYVDDQALTVIFLVTNFYFLFRSGNTFYHEKGWKLILKTGIMILCLKAALEVYRMILFLITLWTL